LSDARLLGAAGWTTEVAEVAEAGVGGFLKPPAVEEVHIVWMTAGLGCDGDSISMTAASQPSIEDVLLGGIPGLPRVHLHNPLLAYEVGDEFMAWWYSAERGELDPFLLVMEGSIPNEGILEEGYWAAFGTDPATGQPITTCEWIDRLAPKAWAIIAAGTCSAYGGIHAMGGNPTGAMGLTDYLGAGWRSPSGMPVINVPGCPVQPDNFMETLLSLLFQMAGLMDEIPLDTLGRPAWLFNVMAREGCSRTSYNENADFAATYNSGKCLARLGCWGPVVNCNVSKRGWMGGVGGCPSVGGICIGCTMPGFPDRFMPFMDSPMSGRLSTDLLRPHGAAIRTLRMITNSAVNVEPEWRRPGGELTTGYDPDHP
jgi:hydrogenase small subunit